MPSQSTKQETIVKDVKNCHQKEPVIPDGGWGWVVCFAAACAYFIVLALTSSIGIFLVSLKRIFYEESIGKLSLVGALINGLSLLAAPVASILLAYFSHRTVLILSGLIGFTGAILGVFSTSSDMMIVTYGLISGVSLGMTYFTFLIITGSYFNKKRALAIGLVYCGGGCGIMLGSLICDYLLRFYGLSSTLLLISGLLLNFVVLGALCRPLQYTCKDVVNKADIAADKTNPHSVIGTPSSVSESYDKGKIIQEGIINKTCDTSDEKQYKGKLSATDNKDVEDEYIIENEKVNRSSVIKRCSNIIGLELFRQPKFVSLLISYTLWAYCNTMYSYIPPMCVWSFGMSEQRSALLLLLVGLFSTFGNFVLGVIIDVLHFSSKMMFSLSLLVIAATAMLMPHCNTFEYMAPVVCVYGVAVGFSLPLKLILTTEIVGLEHSTKAYSVVSVFNGLTYFVSPPIFGLIFDLTGSFRFVFYGCGIFLLIAFILFFLIICRGKP